MKARVKVLLMAAVMSVLMALPAFAGEWKSTNNSWWYLCDDGTYYAGGTALIDGQWYIFDANGYMMTGWIEDPAGWMYCAPDGHTLIDEQATIDGIIYQFDSTGIAFAIGSEINEDTMSDDPSGNYVGNSDSAQKIYIFEDQGKYYAQLSAPSPIMGGNYTWMMEGEMSRVNDTTWIVTDEYGSSARIVFYTMDVLSVYAITDDCNIYSGDYSYSEM